MYDIGRSTLFCFDRDEICIICNFPIGMKQVNHADTPHQPLTAPLYRRLTISIDREERLSSGLLSIYPESYFYESPNDQ